MKRRLLFRLSARIQVEMYCKSPSLIVPNNIKFGEAPWSSGERQGLTLRAMVLGCEFDSQVHLKTRWILSPNNQDKALKFGILLTS
jgi:hypothetical protein